MTLNNIDSEMGVIARNANLSITFSLTFLRLVGFWAPDDLTLSSKTLYNVYTGVSFMFFLGSYLIIQAVDLFLIWGNLPLMTSIAFVLFTNLAHAVKIANILGRRKMVQRIIDECDAVLRGEESEEGRAIVRRCNRETSCLQISFFLLTIITAVGWSGSAEKGQLPLRAWYPYDSSKSPAYELTYGHQVFGVFILGLLNVGKDTLVTTLIAQCKCRLQLIGLSLRKLCHEIKYGSKLTHGQEAVVTSRLKVCVVHHQAALETALKLQACFTVPTFAQFTVSLIIICATAFQLVSQTGNLVRLFSMGTYLLNMMFQVFIYCYQGNNFAEESSKIAGAAYESPWYTYSVRLRRSLLVVMARTRREAKLTALGFTTLSLASFMSIIKASYSLFTLLKQVTENN